MQGGLRTCKERGLHTDREELYFLVYKHALWYNLYISFSVAQFQYACVIRQFHKTKLLLF